MKTVKDRVIGLRERAVWIFDLDNTLYPSECDLFAQVRQRMGEWIAAYFAIGPEEARLLQRRYFQKHGTTLRGLMTEDGIDPHDYLSYVHDIDLDGVRPDTALGQALDGLPGRKLVFTNASTAHAERVLGKLGIADRFEAIFDVEAAEFLPKPNDSAYQALLARHDIDPQGAVMVEDMPVNLEPAHRLGMATVLVKTDLDWSVGGKPGAPHIHHIIENLPVWLEALPRAD